MCNIIRSRCLLYPGSRHLIARYAFTNLKKTLWMQTLKPIIEEDVKNGLCTVNQQPLFIRYINGSTILLDGLEPSRIDGVLGGEYSTIWVNEANENKWQIIELLFSRLNDNSKHINTGEPIKTQFWSDLNPSSRESWDCKFFAQKLNPEDGTPHKQSDKIVMMRLDPSDNVYLSDDYLETIESMSATKKRRFGDKADWSSYEGLVYNFKDEYIFDIDDTFEEKLKRFKKVYGIDFGYVHPFTCIFVAYDDSNEHYYAWSEYSYTRRTVSSISSDLLPEISKYLWDDYVSDHDSEDRATLEENDILTRPADKRVNKGIDTVEDIIDRGKLSVARNCSNLIAEMYTYRYKDKARPKNDREVVKEFDDHLDALRYAIMAIAAPRFTPTFIRAK